MTAGGKPWPKALVLGIVSSAFFSVTYVLNTAMALGGGDWMWSASLRYLWMLPMLLLLNLPGGGLKTVWREVGRSPWRWLLWSLVGFGAFYAPLSFASAYGPSWMVAGTFQFTILAGALETPLFRDAGGKRGKIPLRLLPAFLVILLGVFLLQAEQMGQGEWGAALLFAAPVLLSAFSYPLGNRKTMELCEGQLTTAQRMLAMTVCSLPLWLLLSAAALWRGGPPSPGQVGQSLAVALFSGLIATLLFFQATQLVRRDPQRLALVESCQCGEVLFSALGGILLLHEPWPSLSGWVGLALVVGGMVANALLTARSPQSP